MYTRVQIDLLFRFQQIDSKMSDIENNNAQLEDIKTQMKNLLADCKQLYSTFDEKKRKVLELRASSGSVSSADFATSAWGDSAWDNAPTVAGGDTAWPVNDAALATNSMDETAVTGITKYRALYEFVARNQDEISFQPGDIILVIDPDEKIVSAPPSNCKDFRAIDSTHCVSG